MSMHLEGQPRYGDISQAMAEIHALESNAMVMGANDLESSEFVRIRTQLQSKEITPEEAINQARGVVDSKNAYH